MGHNELLLAEALRGQRDKAFIQVKYGALRAPDGSFLGTDARPVELGIGITAYGVLSRGLLTGSKGSGEGDVRSTYYPRFQGENLTKNERLAAALAEVARNEGITAAQAAIGWVLSQGDDIIPLVGARTVERLTEALAAPLRLSSAALASIEEAVPQEAVHGDRFMVH